MIRSTVSVLVVLACARPGFTQNLNAASVQAVAGAAAQSSAEVPRESTYDRIWRFARWYRNDSNPVVQQVLFSGRYQQDFATISADQGSFDEWNVRRLRLGPRITLFHDFTFHSEVELNPQEADPLYVRLTDFYLEWSQSERLEITLGKHGVPFTMDGSTSSKELLTIDRSNLTNNFWFTYEYIPGISVSGTADAWVYRAGVFSSGEATREFGKFNGGGFVLGVVGYDFAERLGTNEALLTGNYVYQQPDRDNTFTKQLEQVASLNFNLADDRWGLRTDLSTAAGYLGQSDLWGAMLMPYVNLTDKLQVVGRYTVLDSEQVNGVRLATYERDVVSGRGDRYDEWYLGANYYFYGHKLKLQSGLQHASLDDSAGDGGEYSGTSWVNGLRVSW